jgi:cystathionine beta-lyase family protein involved in aluminum resistance
MQQLEKETFDQQTLQIKEYRRQLEEEKAKRLRDMEVAYKQANAQQLEEKVNKEALDRQLETHEKLGHIQYLTGHDFFTENTVIFHRCRTPANQL